MVLQESEMSQPGGEFPAAGPDRPRASGPRRVLFVTAGLICVGLAYLGALLPGLPTTPWVLLAGYCFSRSSRRLERWLKRSPIFGRLLRDWETHRGIRRPMKILSAFLLLTVVTLSITQTPLPPWAKWSIGGLAVLGLSVLLFVVPTVRDPAVTVAKHDMSTETQANQ